MITAAKILEAQCGPIVPLQCIDRAADIKCRKRTVITSMKFCRISKSIRVMSGMGRGETGDELARSLARRVGRSPVSSRGQMAPCQSGVCPVRAPRPVRCGPRSVGHRHSDTPRAAPVVPTRPPRPLDGGNLHTSRHGGPKLEYPKTSGCAANLIEERQLFYIVM